MLPLTNFPSELHVSAEKRIPTARCSHYLSLRSFQEDVHFFPPIVSCLSCKMFNFSLIRPDQFDILNRFMSYGSLHLPQLSHRPLGCYQISTLLSQTNILDECSSLSGFAIVPYSFHFHMVDRTMLLIYNLSLLYEHTTVFSVLFLQI